jgi:hypothetical protein
VRHVADEDVPEFDLHAAGLRADGADVMRDVEVLADKLERALGDRCTVGRRRKGMFSGDRRVETVAVDLGGNAYRLQSDGRRVTATRGKAVGGVTIKRDDLELDAWLQALAADLRAEAGSSQAARDALTRLLEG